VIVGIAVIVSFAVVVIIAVIGGADPRGRMVMVMIVLAMAGVWVSHLAQDARP
jgi:hypothetical protein